MEEVVVFPKDRSTVLTQTAYTMAVGIGGTLILTFFFSTFLNLYHIVRFLPWFVALNTAMTGYALLERTREQVVRKRLCAMLVGVATAAATFLILVGLSWYALGASPLTWWDLLVFAVIGGVCSELGGLLAIKYFKIK